MTSLTLPERSSGSAGAADAGGSLLARAAVRWETGLVLFLFAVLQQSLGQHNPDNSWLLTVCERLLGGERVYSDFYETNPPASFLIYLPAVISARLLHLPSEFMASLFVFAEGLASLWFSLAIAVRGGLLKKEEVAVVRNAGIFATFILAGICFAQREHIAMIALLPVLFVYAVRAEGGEVSGAHALAAGITAGVGVCIKPHFALVMALPFAMALLRTRSVKLFWKTENIAAAAVVAAYAVMVVVLFGEFLAYAKILMATYMQANSSRLVLMGDETFIAASALLLASIAAIVFVRFSALAASLAAGSLGFAIAALVQAKGWINHFQPGLSLAFLALAVAAMPMALTLAGRTASSILPKGGLFVAVAALLAMIATPLTMGVPHQLTMQEIYPGLKAAIQRVAPEHPKIIAISATLGVPFPVTRHVHGIWVGKTQTMWMMASARYLLDKGRGDPAKMREYIDRDARMFAGSVHSRKPDVILSATGPHEKKIWQNPHIIAAMKNYRLADTVSNVQIYVPKTRAEKSLAPGR
ncbi:MAG: hypothetical protein KDJ29_20085 [Hyphomicrobiales bacterium]|nr:hypothetical protein [Hyphomicrobiales bacterium]